MSFVLCCDYENECLAKELHKLFKNQNLCFDNNFEAHRTFGILLRQLSVNLV